FVLFSLVELNLRILTYDETGMTLAGTVHIVVQEPEPIAGNPTPNPLASFLVPITFTVPVNGTIPGTNVAYVGDKTGGAQISNLDQYPFRERFDSVVWQGHVRQRIAIRQDLRVIDFNDDR